MATTPGLSQSGIIFQKAQSHTSIVLIVAYSELFWMLLEITAVLYMASSGALWYNLWNTDWSPICCLQNIIGCYYHSGSCWGWCSPSWGSQKLVSTPAASNKAFSHLAMELEVTALCGHMVAMKSLFSSSLRGSVLPHILWGLVLDTGADPGKCNGGC